MSSEVVEDEFEFYSKAEKYWKDVPATVDGMLGGYGHISSIDINSSRKFLQRFLRDGPNRTGTTRALDCGAGIGRITKRLLLPLFKTVDMVDVTEDFLTKAKSYLGEEGRRVRNYYCCGLQDFSPEPNSYDVIWIQWVIGEGRSVACPLPVQPHGHQGGLEESGRTGVGLGLGPAPWRVSHRRVFSPKSSRPEQEGGWDRAGLSPRDTSWTPPSFPLKTTQKYVTALIRRDPNTASPSPPLVHRAAQGVSHPLTPALPPRTPHRQPPLRLPEALPGRAAAQRHRGHQGQHGSGGRDHGRCGQQRLPGPGRGPQDHPPRRAAPPGRGAPGELPRRDLPRLHLRHEMRVPGSRRRSLRGQLGAARARTASPAGAGRGEDRAFTARG
uniref:protein N-terminal methyltransferase n=1 Tax=Anser brachyrhynchus TaxID=132585 RepID=A0A8B9CSI9_9AVES